MKKIILVINLGSTSTKLAIYDYNILRQEKTYFHPKDELKDFSTIYSQKNFRKKLVLDFIDELGLNLSEIDIFVGRGGLLKPIKSGTYLINDQMIEDLSNETYGSHASNLGAILVNDLAGPGNIAKYIVDPVVVDELSNLARVTGYKDISKISIFHALNQKAVAKEYADKIGKDYNDLNLIVVHLGGGISVGYHHLGEVVDVNNALGGEGPFSPERSGTLPSFQLIDLCYSQKYTKEELKRELVGKGGLVSLLGTNDGREISSRIDNDDKTAAFYLEAMAYQIVKEIGSLYFISKANIDAIIFTGGLVKNQHLMDYIKQMLPTNLNIDYYPGENEMAALLNGVLRVIEGKEEIKIYN